MDFDKSDAVRGPRVMFKLGGREWHCKAATDVPLNMLRIEVDENDPAAILTAVKRFFSGMLMESETADFEKLIDDPQSPVTMGNGMVLVQQIIEEVSKPRPTPRSSSSAVGSRSTKLKSVANSSSGATARKR